MSKYAVNEQGVAALNTMATALENSVDVIAKRVGDVNKLIDEYGNTLGPQGTTTLKSAMDGISATISTSFDSVYEVSAKLTDIADDYQEEIDNDPFSGIDGGPQRVRRR